MPRTSPTILLTALTIICFGCEKKKEADPTATVSGKVTLPGGKPLPGGRILFQAAAAANKLSAGDIKADGTYEAVGVPQGECKVSIENGFLKPIANPTSADVKPDPSLKYVSIPATLASPETSGLVTNVTGPTHTYNVELK
ncbi:MAG: hypothetical protein K8U57_11530 [Planctomycetes bacterium]|nr:hypothetical protein [Planctomycetota bacterium]